MVSLLTDSNHFCEAPKLCRSLKVFNGLSYSDAYKSEVVQQNYFGLKTETAICAPTCAFILPWKPWIIHFQEFDLIVLCIISVWCGRARGAQPPHPGLPLFHKGLRNVDLNLILALSNNFDTYFKSLLGTGGNNHLASLYRVECSVISFSFI